MHINQLQHQFESSVNSEYSKTTDPDEETCVQFESSVNSEYSKTAKPQRAVRIEFESSVNSEYSKTATINSLREAFV